MTRKAPDAPVYGDERKSGVTDRKVAEREAKKLLRPWSKKQRLVSYATADVDDPENAAAFSEEKPQGIRKPRKIKGGRVTDKSEPYCRMAKWLMVRRGFAGDECLFVPFANQGFRASVRFNFKRIAASRAMCVLAHGTPPFVGAMAIHSCGNGHLSCVNPKHLRWGSARDNANDARLHHGDMTPVPANIDPFTHPLPKVAAIETGVTAATIRKLRSASA